MPSQNVRNSRLRETEVWRRKWKRWKICRKLFSHKNNFSPTLEFFCNYKEFFKSSDVMWHSKLLWTTFLIHAMSLWSPLVTAYAFFCQLCLNCKFKDTCLRKNIWHNFSCLICRFTTWNRNNSFSCTTNSKIISKVEASLTSVKSILLDEEKTPAFQQRSFLRKKTFITLWKR